MNFIDFWNKGRFGAENVLATILLIIVAYLLGSSFLLIDLGLNFPDFSYASNFDIKELSSLMGKNRFFIWMLIPFCFVFITFLLCLTKIHKLPLLAVFTSRHAFDWKRFFIAFSWWSLMVLAVTGIELLLHKNFQLVFNAQKFFTLCLLSIILLPLQTSSEELVFRGYILQGIKKRTGSILSSILISGCMFGMMHISNPEIAKIGYHILIYYIIVGVVLGAIVYYDSGLELSLGFHAANNLITALLITADWQAFQTDAIIVDSNPPGNGILSMLLALSMLFAFFLLLNKKYKWKVFTKREGLRE
jgi:membrane protease YdiL (CAAX protease family)